MSARATARRAYRPASPAPAQNLLSLASQVHLDAGKIEQLIAADERRWAREAALAFTGAFTEMSAVLPVIDENGVLRHGDKVAGSYALWEDINEAIRPILSQFGFALSFRVNQDADSITVTAVLSHKGGHAETTSLRLPPDISGDKNSVQAVGSSVSYGKRYAATALLNITSRGEDDDGRRGSGCVTAEQVKKLEATLSDCGADRTRLLRYLQVETLELIPTQRFDEALAAIEAKTTKPRGRR